MKAAKGVGHKKKNRGRERDLLKGGQKQRERSGVPPPTPPRGTLGGGTGILWPGNPKPGGGGAPARRGCVCAPGEAKTAAKYTNIGRGVVRGTYRIKITGTQKYREWCYCVCWRYLYFKSTGELMYLIISI